MEIFDAKTAMDITMKARELDITSLMDWIGRGIKKVAESGEPAFEALVRTSKMPKVFGIQMSQAEKAIIKAVKSLHDLGYSATFSVNSHDSLGQACLDPLFIIHISWLGK